MKSKRVNVLLSCLLISTMVLGISGCGNGVNNASSTEVKQELTETIQETFMESPADSLEAYTISDTGADASAADSTSYPITIQHAFGETVIESKPERVATIAWGNQDVPLALNVIPVGVSQANYGVGDGSLLLPWTADKFAELGVENPVVFSDTDGLDYEAISDTQPDVILAAYSGITQEEYDLLTQIAPVIAYPEYAYQTYWREQITMSAEAMGMKNEGEALVTDLEETITEKLAEYPQIEGKNAAFFYFDASDLGKFYVYLLTDPRAAYLVDLGLELPESIAAMGEGAESFALELSAENVDQLSGVDIIVTYGDDQLLASMQADTLIGRIPAVQNGAVAVLENNSPLAASGNPSALSIPVTIDEYLSVLAAAADNVQ